MYYSITNATHKTYSEFEETDTLRSTHTHRQTHTHTSSIPSVPETLLSKHQTHTHTHTQRLWLRAQCWRIAPTLGCG